MPSLRYRTQGVRQAATSPGLGFLWAALRWLDIEWMTTAIPDGGRIVGVDFETTGLDHDTDRVVCIGIAVAANGRLDKCHQIFVDPGRPMPAAATRINGIGERVLEDAPPWPTARRLLVETTECALVVAHRLPFETAFWSAEDARAGLASPRRAGICSKLLAAGAGLRASDTGLRAACRAFDVDPRRHLTLADLGLATEALWHSAVWDAAAAVLLASRLIDSAGPIGGPELAKVAHDRIAAGGRRALQRYMHPHRRDLDLYRRAVLGDPANRLEGDDRQMAS